LIIPYNNQYQRCLIPHNLTTAPTRPYNKVNHKSIAHSAKAPTSGYYPATRGKADQQTDYRQVKTVYPLPFPGAKRRQLIECQI
jgi:hypothetical protein